MKDERDFERLREDIESSQKAILWEDARIGGRSVDDFLWKGDPKAKPIQRAGLIVFALLFLFPTILLLATPFVKEFADGSTICFFVAVFPLLISARLLRNALLRPPNHRKDDEPTYD